MNREQADELIKELEDYIDVTWNYLLRDRPKKSRPKLHKSLLCPHKMRPGDIFWWGEYGSPDVVLYLIVDEDIDQTIYVRYDNVSNPSMLWLDVVLPDLLKKYDQALVKNKELERLYHL